MSFQNKQSPLEVFVPANATEVFGQLKQGDSKMAIPLNLVDGQKGKVLDRPILPGHPNCKYPIRYPQSLSPMYPLKTEMNFEDKKSRELFSLNLEIKIDIKGAVTKKK